MAIKVKIVPCMRWVHTETGQQVSVHGACPWGHVSEIQFWKKKQVGWTVYNINENTYGFGRPPFASREGLEAHLKSHPEHFEIVEG